ncbi:SAM-dependent methyltransferase [Streptosporangium becharense]|uniref:SAM-dependent methyltransferase n=1 Tax=Streptosporangium becharense TaxID=1816182 RepID=A0A7W9MIZ6_9ACTN|nr:class I SAM-dependent methyltransferase [Streptosporangium becharense]MBB2911465.1 SAM-dependent methyltransferase [Streptosporangium becharense]MBB5822717.1 SAM-dependent methyltransferase [Streptosporangium becharense]
MDRENGIEARWVTWQEAGEEIVDLRRRAFVDELGWNERWVRHARDPEGLHLCAMSGGKIVAVISAYLYEPGAPELADAAFPDATGLSVQLGKRVEVEEHRGRLVSARIGTSMLRQICESLRPARIFLLLLRNGHPHLADRYARRGFVRHADVGSGDDALTVMKVEGEQALEDFHLNNRHLDRKAATADDPIHVPSLVRFLTDNGRADLLAVDRLNTENLYLQSLPPGDELPRLTAQGRLVLAEQRPRLAETPFPPAPASLLDIGSGPGDYLAALAQEPPFAGYRIHGVEPSPELLTTARTAFPGHTFHPGSAYTTGQPDSSHDVVTASFVFIHLRSPDLALLEIRRVLRPGGLLYVVDADNSTFRGPDPVRRLMEAYDHDYPGDRLIMKDLTARAAEFGFRPVRRFVTTMRNTGGPEPIFGPDEIRLGREEAWSILSFLRAQRGGADAFREAEEHYFGTGCEISMDVETRVYRLDPAD